MPVNSLLFYLVFYHFLSPPPCFLVDLSRNAAFISSDSPNNSDSKGDRDPIYARMVSLFYSQSIFTSEKPQRLKWKSYLLPV